MKTNLFRFSVYRSSFGVILSRIFGLFRDVSIASFFGASKVTDIFFIAFAIPNLFRAFFAEGALASAFVPIFSDKLAKDRYSALKYLSGLIGIVFIITTLIVLVFIIFSKYIIIFFMPGYYGQQEVLTTASGLLKILMPYLPIITICGLLSGFLNINKIYFIPHSSTALLNLAMIIGAFVGGYLGANIYILAYSVILGGLMQFIYIFIFSKRAGFSFIIDKNQDKDIKKTFYLIIPSIIGLSINQLNFIVGRILASFLKEGSISYLYYANRLYQLPIGVFSVTTGIVSLTELSLAYSRNKFKDSQNILNEALLTLSIFIIPAFCGLFLLSEDIVSLIYMHYNFTYIDVENTSSALRMYSIGLIFISLVNVFTRAYHAKKDLLTPVKISIIVFIINIALILLLMKSLSHAGIALASSIASFVNALFLYIKLKEFKFSFKKNKDFLLKVVFSSIAMSLLLLVVKMLNINVIFNIIICIIFYFALLRLLKIDYRGVKL